MIQKMAIAIFCLQEKLSEVFLDRSKSEDFEVFKLTTNYERHQI